MSRWVPRRPAPILPPAGAGPSTLALGDAGGEPILFLCAQAYLTWLRTHGAAENTVISYGRDLGGFVQFAAAKGCQAPSQITVPITDAWLLQLRRRGLAATSTSRARAALIGLYRFLEHEGVVAVNVPAKTYPIRTGTRVPVYLEPHEIDRFLHELAALPDLVGRRDHAMVATLFCVGPRVSELAALRLTDVDLVGNRIRIERGKGGKTRVLVIPPRLRPILRAYLDEVRSALVGRPVGSIYRPRNQRTWKVHVGGRIVNTGTEDYGEARRFLKPPPAFPFFFVNGSGHSYRMRHAERPLTTRGIYAAIRARAKAILGKTISPHVLRHTCASYLLHHNASLETIQKLLGHADIRTTFVYLHVPSRAMEDEMNRIMVEPGAGGENTGAGLNERRR